jgi:hypothetical protein
MRKLFICCFLLLWFRTNEDNCFWKQRSISIKLKQWNQIATQPTIWRVCVRFLTNQTNVEVLSLFLFFSSSNYFHFYSNVFWFSWFEICFDWWCW